MGAAFLDSVSRHTRMALGLLRSIAEHPPLAPIPCYLGATLAGFQIAGFGLSVGAGEGIPPPSPLHTEITDEFQ
jgi:hypothetical protein